MTRDRQPHLYIGIMSGTSMDGIDAALCSFPQGQARIHATHSLAIPPALRQSLATLQHPSDNEIHNAMLAGNQLARCYAELTHALLQASGVSASQVRAIGGHGQTIRHQPHAGYTVQLLNGALLAELSGIDVVCDFRSRDIAAGGQGAPLVPAFHASLLGSATSHRAVLNIGGMANLTNLPSDGSTSGFDCGPGNVLMDDWILATRREPFDSNGDWARSGSPDRQLLEDLLAHPFFAKHPPKSCGREDFNLDWLRKTLGDRQLGTADIQATLLELTATSIANATKQHCVGAGELIICGGGAHNVALVSRIKAMLPTVTIHTSSDFGISPCFVEAVAFAWLAARFSENESGNLPRVTGASGQRILGALHKH